MVIDFSKSANGSTADTGILAPADEMVAIVDGNITSTTEYSLLALARRIVSVLVGGRSSRRAVLLRLRRVFAIQPGTRRGAEAHRLGLRYRSECDDTPAVATHPVDVPPPSTTAAQRAPTRR